MSPERPESERPTANSSEAIAKLEGQVTGLNFKVDLLTKRVVAMEQREFMYQIAALVTVMVVFFIAITIILLND